MPKALRSPKFWFHTWAILMSLSVPWSLASGQCDPTVPSFAVDLSASPTATYLSPVVQRQDHCCGATDPDQCIEFIITLHPAAQGIVFDICSGAIPSGSMFYQLNCGTPTAVGTPLCLNGPGPHAITFCKPGNNNNEYCITSIAAPSAGPDASVNDGCSATLTTTGFAPGTTTWTSISPGGTGAYDAFLSCPTCANTLVTGGTGYPAAVDYLVCGNAVSPCSATIYCDTVRVYFNPTLTATIMPLQPTICFGATSTTITAIGGGGSPPYSFLWNTGETTAMIPAGLGNYSVQISDATNCPPTGTSVTVTEFQQPIQALAGADITVCGGGSAQLNAAVTGASGGLWTTGAGQFQPSTTALNATYTPSAAEVVAGTVTLVLETTGNGTCPGDQDTLVVTFPPPFPSMSVAVTDASCQGGTDGMATVIPAIGGYTYLWTDAASQTSSMANGLGAGPFAVTITDPAGCAITLNTTVAEPSAITITNVMITNETCADNGDGSVSVSASGGTPPYNYVWSNGDTSSSIAVGAGTYTVSVSDANGCAPDMATATVISTAQPNIATAGTDQIVCMNDYPIALSGSVQNAAGGIWSGGTGTFSGSGLYVTYAPSAAEIAMGGVDLTLTTSGNSACPADNDVTHLTLPNSFINASLSHMDALCSGSSSGTATFTPSLPSLTYLWSPSGQTAATAINLSSGTHSVTVTDTYGCDTTMSVIVSQPPPLAVVNMQLTNPSCAGSSNGNASVTAQGGTPGYTYQWSANAGAQTTAVASNLSTGIYILTVMDDNGCTVQGSATITAPPQLQLTAQVPDTICANAPVQLTAQASGGDGNLLINWTGIGSGTSLVYSFPASQNVMVTVTDGAGCTGPVLNLSVYVLDLTTATLMTAGDTTVCPGGSTFVSAQVVDYPGSVSYHWSELQVWGSGPHTVLVNNTQTLNVSATNSCGQVLTGSVLLTLETPPLITLPPLIAEGCAPLTVQFPDSLTLQNVTWLWVLGDGNTSTAMAPLHTYAAGSYIVTLTVTTAAGCSANALNTSSVTAFAPPIAGFTASTYSSDMDSPTVTFTDISSGSINGYTWDLGDGTTSNTDSPTHTYTNVGEFLVELTVTDVNGCTDMAVATITMGPIHDIEIPNAFTPDPNGGGGYYDPTDLGNDIFYPFVDYVKDFRMRIWNRWGELVFESDEITKGWDGWYKGRPSQQDVYVYECWFRFVDGFEAERMGDLTLFR